MSDSLDDVIRNLAARGELSHLSIIPSKNGWRASFTMCSKFGVSFAEDKDPVKALVLACTTAKMKPQRQPSLKPMQEAALKDLEHGVSNATDAEPADDVESLM